MMNQVNIVVDIGGSGTRIGKVENNHVINQRKATISSIGQLVKMILEVAGNCKPDAVAVSTAGFVNSRLGYVRLSRVARWAEGDLANKLKSALGISKVIVMNDGEAHALSTLSDNRMTYGAVCLSLGTSVGFGILDENRHIMRTLSGENWDVGEMWLKTRATDEHVWWSMGSQGLKELTTGMGSEGYAHYGYRLGFFLSQLSVIFMPRTIALSGGIIFAHWDKIQKTALSELRADIPEYMACPQVLVLRDKESALTGLIYALQNQK